MKHEIHPDYLPLSVALAQVNVLMTYLNNNAPDVVVAELYGSGLCDSYVEEKIASLKRSFNMFYAGLDGSNRTRLLALANEQYHEQQLDDYWSSYREAAQ
jgi:hypothetical protein